MTKPSRLPANRRAKYSGKHTMSIDANLGAINEMLDGLNDEVQRAIRPMAQAAADVLYRAVLKNVQSIGSQSGNLARSIYQAFSQDNSSPTKATYHVSWNASKAPHGHLIEWGHIQRYAVHLGKDGKWHTLVRPEKRGTPKPRRRASQAEKDAYFVMRKGGPKQIAAKPFVRPAQYQAGAAAQAATQKLYEVLGL